MMREPIATTQTQQVRVVANMLMKDDFLPSLFDCAVTSKQINQGIAQSAFISVESHNVVSGR